MGAVCDVGASVQTIPETVDTKRMFLLYAGNSEMSKLGDEVEYVVGSGLAPVKVTRLPCHANALNGSSNAMSSFFISINLKCA